MLGAPLTTQLQRMIFLFRAFSENITRYYYYNPHLLASNRGYIKYGKAIRSFESGAFDNVVIIN